VLDHAGNTLRHGLPEEDRVWTLDGVEKVKRAPAEINVDGINLGRKRVVEQVAGDLIEAESAKQAQARWGKVSMTQFKQHPRTEAQARAFAKVKGYKKGWAFYFMREQRERFGYGAAA
jgi:DNA repair protein RadD